MGLMATNSPSNFGRRAGAERAGVGESVGYSLFGWRRAALPALARANQRFNRISGSQATGRPTDNSGTAAGSRNLAGFQ
jgi:hypothetical protein